MDETTKSVTQHTVITNGYPTGNSITSNKVDNPLAEIADNLESDIDREKRNKWEKTATFIGLNNVFQNIGGIISSQNGVNAPLKDDGMLKTAMAKADEYDKRVNDKYNQLYKATLTNALNQIERKEEIEDNYMKSLENIRASEVSTAQLSMRLEDNAADRASKEAINKAQIEAKARSYNLPSSKSTKIKEPAMYVYSIKGNKVGLADEQVSRMYQIGKLSKLDTDYLRATNENQRKREFDILIQQAYNLYERNKESYDTPQDHSMGPYEYVK